MPIDGEAARADAERIIRCLAKQMQVEGQEQTKLTYEELRRLSNCRVVKAVEEHSAAWNEQPNLPPHPGLLGLRGDTWEPS